MRSNGAAEGAGIALAGGSRLTARQCQLGGNALAGDGADGTAGAAAGADLLLLDADNSAAYLDPLPGAGELSGEAAALF